jgi:hypothetical protein
LASLPDKTTQINTAFSVVTGTEFAEPAVDPGTAALNSLITRATDGSDPIATSIGTAAAAAAIDENGRFDSQTYTLRLAELMSQYDSDRAAVARTQLEVEKLKAENAFTQESQNTILDNRVGVWSQRTQELTEGLIARFFGSSENGGPVPELQRLSREDAILQLESLEARLRNTYQQEAAELGILDNLGSQFDGGGINEALAPLTNFKTFLTRSREEFFESWKVAETQDKMAIAQLINEMSGAGGTIPEVQEYVVTQILVNNQVDFKQVALNARRMLKDIVRTGNPYRTSLGENNGISTDAAEQGRTGQIVTPEAAGVATGLSEGDAIKSVKSDLTVFYEWNNFGEVNDSITKTAVSSFVNATQIMNVRGVPVSENTFDMVYRPEFFNMFNQITAVGGENGQLLVNAVVENLSDSIANNLTLATNSIAQTGGQNFPSVALKFDGEKYVMQVGSLGATAQEVALKDTLRQEGLPFTLEGIKELQKRERSVVSNSEAIQKFRFTNTGLNAYVENFEKHLNYLNKMTSVAARLGTEVLTAVTPGEGSPFLLSPVAVEVTNEDEYKSLEEGTSYTVMNKEGTGVAFSGIKGREEF